MRGNAVIAHRRLEGCASRAASLTRAFRLPAGSSPLFPASLRTLLEMAPLGSWGLPAALLALLCCPGEPVPGVPDLAWASPEGGPPAPLALGGGGVLAPKSPRI